MAVSANRLELLQIADAVAREKSIDREIVIAAMADAIQKAARSRYGQETNGFQHWLDNTGNTGIDARLGDNALFMRGCFNRLVFCFGAVCHAEFSLFRPQETKKSGTCVDPPLFYRPRI